MDIDSEDDIFNEEEEVDEDVWGIVWDAEIEEDDFDGDLFDNGDVDQSSIDESEEMSAGVLEDQLREKVAMYANPSFSLPRPACARRWLQSTSVIYPCCRDHGAAFPPSSLYVTIKCPSMQDT